MNNFLDNHQKNSRQYNNSETGESSINQPVKKKMVLRKTSSINTKDTGNIFLEGDNLESLKILQKEYGNKIKTIYIDPPYNTRKGRLYVDNFTKSNKDRHQGWLSMMFPRLYLAKKLLSDKGTIFISIGLDESHHLRIAMDELFGEKNLISEVVWHSKYTKSNDKKFISVQHEYILIYAKDIRKANFNLLPRTKKADNAYRNPDNDPRGRWKLTPLHAKSGSTKHPYQFTKIRKFNGEKIPPFMWSAPKGRYPRYSKATLKKLERDGKITCGMEGTGVPGVKTFLSKVKQGMTAGSLWEYEQVGHTHQANEELSKLVGKGVWDNPKPIKLIRQILQLSTNPKSNDIVLDFFAGSGTTAHAVLEANSEDDGNRRFICIQEKMIIDREGYHTIADVAKYRIRKVIQSINKKTKPYDKKIKVGFRDYVLKNKIRGDVQHKDN